jgi:hypothetical protein
MEGKLRRSWIKKTIYNRADDVLADIEKRYREHKETQEQLIAAIEFFRAQKDQDSPEDASSKGE